VAKVKGSKEAAQRDARGRWVKGYCPNKSGRPRKRLMIDHGHVERFMNTILEVKTPDGEKMMTRQGAVLNRLFQSALQGNVHAQIYLDRKFHHADQQRAELAAELSRSKFQMSENPNWRPTAWQQAIMATAEQYLSDPGSDEVVSVRKMSRERKK
jgi:hypothetical protein